MHIYLYIFLLCYYIYLFGFGSILIDFSLWNVCKTHTTLSSTRWQVFPNKVKYTHIIQGQFFFFRKNIRFLSIVLRIKQKSIERLQNLPQYRGLQARDIIQFFIDARYSSGSTRFSGFSSANQLPPR